MGLASCRKSSSVLPMIGKKVSKDVEKYLTFQQQPNSQKKEKTEIRKTNAETSENVIPCSFRRT
jgi:hypothetical protein